MKLPRTLLGGRVRTSTLGLLMSFAMVMTAWILVRPEPVQVTEEVVTVRTTKKIPNQPAPTPSPRPTETPKPTPAPATPKPTKDPAAPPATPTSDGSDAELPTPTPVPSRTPDGLF